MWLNWINEKIPSGSNDQGMDCDEFDVGFDFALSFDMVDQLSCPVIGDSGVRAHADKMKWTLDEHELALR